MKLAGKKVVITGAASGIGQAMLEAFTGEGAQVFAADNAADRLSRYDGRSDVIPHFVDVTVPAAVDEMIDVAVDQLGGIDILCNNAGRPDRMLGVDECTDEEWEYGLALHLTAPFLATRRALPHMLRAGYGLILNMSSVAGFSGANAGASYTAAKFALNGLSKNIAAMYGLDGIRCVAICPGRTDTGATEVVVEYRAAGLLSARYDAARARTQDAFLRRADPSEVGALALFLACGGADVLNGAVLTADSGFSAH